MTADSVNEATDYLGYNNMQSWLSIFK